MQNSSSSSWFPDRSPSFPIDQLPPALDLRHKQIQLKSSCVVRIATSGMYFPGTMERAVLVAGGSEGVKVRRMIFMVMLSGVLCDTAKRKVAKDVGLVRVESTERGR